MAAPRPAQVRPRDQRELGARRRGRLRRKPGESASPSCPLVARAPACGAVVAAPSHSSRVTLVTDDSPRAWRLQLLPRVWEGPRLPWTGNPGEDKQPSG